MTYLDYINQFWQTQADVQFSSNEAYLYFFLLKECNTQGWENPFECPNRRILLSIGMSEPTLIDCRNRLQQKGLISFQAGKRRAKSPVYYLNNLSKNFSKDFSKDFSKNFSKDLSSYIEYRYKDNNNSRELFAPEPPKKASAKKKTEAPAFPSLDEVKAYFEGKIPGWEEQAEKFFYHFDSLGWRNTNGTKIARWQSKANLWILDEQSKLMQNEQNSTNRRADSSTSSSESGKAGKLKAIEL